jgi:hypothetical protein
MGVPADVGVGIQGGAVGFAPTLAGADESDDTDMEDEKDDAVHCGKTTENDSIFGLRFPSAADDRAPQKEVIQEHAREGGAKSGGGNMRVLLT